MKGPTIESVLADPSASKHLKEVLERWLERDPVDAVNDAEVLLCVLQKRLDQIFANHL